MTHLDPFTDYTINEQYDRMMCRMICKCGRDETAPGHVLRERGWVEIEDIMLCTDCSPYQSRNVCPACLSFSPRGVFHKRCLGEVNSDLDDINSFVPHGNYDLERDALPF